MKKKARTSFLFALLTLLLAACNRCMSRQPRTAWATPLVARRSATPTASRCPRRASPKSSAAHGNSTPSNKSTVTAKHRRPYDPGMWRPGDGMMSNLPLPATASRHGSTTNLCSMNYLNKTDINEDTDTMNAHRHTGPRPQAN